ncbi:tartrate dehydrogenase/decarboxylase/D-malate dehydrogenase [Tamaricihabitans halophyticus]|uniref:D-malate dehydrogenase (decarboxylating) n=1 Tax=Tamaricihabitans halophyticus TaxID=1262583 RepID=A0A4R2QWT8_9PSEU|nr:tartrate dehydrogenase [Tamaricihabitans halophyticus]TCP54177.1 tartrate dehydrogenase/decarboxylase/D-malate dehydrogenase [Tamaricihabitans halophyticus]
MATRAEYRIDVIAGDGIGREVVPAAISCIDTLADKHEFRVHWQHRDWGSDYYRAHGRMMPTDGLDQLAKGDGVFLGAVGVPDIPDTETLWGLLIPIRRSFHQYVNLRPVRTLPGVRSPLRGGDELDLVIVRENVEGEYSEVGGRLYQGRPEEAAVQESIFTRAGVARIARYAAQLAASRKGVLTSATKSNGIVHTMPFWDEVVAEHAGEVRLDSVLIDALAARLVLQPSSVDVIVASNLFGDILSDLAAGVAGSIGVAPSGNINPEREFPSMFEPVHGSAPDIAGQGVANPTGQLWAGAMMLEHLGQPAAAAQLERAFAAALADGVRTADLGGEAGTEEFTAAVLDRL